MPNSNFTTQDYSLANWLVFNRVTLIGTVEYSGDTRKSFVFLDSERIPKLEAEWENPQDQLTKTCKRFFEAHSIIKKALKDSLSVD